MNWWWLIGIEYAVLGIGAVVLAVRDRRRERRLALLLADLLTPRIANPTLPTLAELHAPSWAPDVRERTEQP